MFELKGARIRLTRGDTAALRVEIIRERENGDREPYEMQAADTLTLSAKKNSLCPAPQLVITNTGEPLLIFSPEDTKNLAPGDYVYDIELKTGEGDVYTVVGQGLPGVDAVLVILPEVTV